MAFSPGSGLAPTVHMFMSLLSETPIAGLGVSTNELMS